jgi:hypothetical protein
LLCSLPDSFDNFVNSMLYGRDTISLADVKSALNSIELRTKLNSKGSDNQSEGLFVKGRSENSSNFKVDPVRGIWVKVNQEANHSPSPRRK